MTRENLRSSQISPALFAAMIAVGGMAAAWHPPAAAATAADIPAIMRLTVDSWVASSQASDFIPYGFNFLADKALEPDRCFASQSDSPGFVVGRTGQLFRLHPGSQGSRSHPTYIVCVRQAFASHRQTEAAAVRRGNAHPFFTRGPMATQECTGPLRSPLPDLGRRQGCQPRGKLQQRAGGHGRAGSFDRGRSTRTRRVIKALPGCGPPGGTDCSVCAFPAEASGKIHRP